jgi:hypothetical protein
MRRVALASLAAPLILVAGCASTPPGGTRCGFTALPDPVIVLESDESTTAALARLAGGCLDEESVADPVLGADQYLLQAHATGQPFVAVDDDGSLRPLAKDRNAITDTFYVYPEQSAPSCRPHGIYGVDADAGGDLWVSRLDVPSVAVLSPKGDPVTTVDLSDLDPDGNPDMNGIVVQDGKAFVLLDFLVEGTCGVTGDTAWQPGAIAVIDVAKRKRTGLIQLPGHNPFQGFAPTGSPGVFLVAMPGRHSDAPMQPSAVSEEDGIDSVDLAAGTATQIISETALGGSVDNVVWASPTEAYAIVLGPEAGVNPTSVVEFDPSRGTVTRTIASPPTDPSAQQYIFVGLALDGDFLLVADQTMADPKIRVFSRATGEEQAAIPTKVDPPVSLLTLSP